MLAILDEEGVQAGCLRAFEVYFPVINKQGLVGVEVLTCKHLVEYLLVRLHTFQLIAEILVLLWHIIAESVALTVKAVASEPRRDERIDIGENGDVVAFRAEFEQLLEVLKLYLHPYIEPCSLAIIPAYLMHAMLRDCLAEVLVGNHAAFLLSEEAFLHVWVKFLVNVFKAELFKSVYCLFDIDFDKHAAKVKNKILYLRHIMVSVFGYTLGIFLISHALVAVGKMDDATIREAIPLEAVAHNLIVLVGVDAYV